jgi:hypothetical protein
MFSLELGVTLATATVRNDTEVIDIGALFGGEVASAISEAAAYGYSDLDAMIADAYSIKKVRLHLAEARWEHDMAENNWNRDIETMHFPLTFKPAAKH